MARFRLSSIFNSTHVRFYPQFFSKQIMYIVESRATVYARNLQSSLLPHHTYGYNSGGEPINIPDLTVSDIAF